MSTSLRKRMTIESPHATFVKGDFEWRVLKVNAPKKGPGGKYATWYVAVKSLYTMGSWEHGDTYIEDVLRVRPELIQATAEFKEYMGV